MRIFKIDLSTVRIFDRYIIKYETAAYIWNKQKTSVGGEGRRSYYYSPRKRKIWLCIAKKTAEAIRSS